MVARLVHSQCLSSLHNFVTKITHDAPILHVPGLYVVAQDILAAG